MIIIKRKIISFLCLVLACVFICSCTSKKVEITDKKLFYAAYPFELEDMQFSKSYTYGTEETSGQPVLCMCSKEITDVNIIGINSDSNGTLSAGDSFYSIESLLPGEVIALNILVPETTPNCGVSFKDGDGKEYCYAISQSGKTGGIVLIDLNNKK